jgi:predicted type IV restriction endonuclease
MRDEINEIRENIKLGKYQNEAAVSQGIVQRVLSLLGWPVYDTSVVIPEYSMELRRVDYALCHPANKPTIFIEIKPIGQSGGAEKQLFEYAFFVGIPLAILTDGQEWHFFLPAEQGEFSDRRVYKLDILERNLDDIVEVLDRYLKYENVQSGKALESARRDYRNIRQKREVANTLPEAWKRLVDEGDELLVDLLIDKVESLCGFKTDPDQVIEFLTTNLVLVSTQVNTYKKEERKPARPQTSTQKFRETRIGFELFGNYYSANNARETMYAALNVFADRDPTFLKRYSSLPKHGRTRRYVAESRKELNPSRPDLAEQYSHEFRTGWFVDVNLSKRSIEQVLRLACQIADIKYGNDFKVFL